MNIVGIVLINLASIGVNSKYRWARRLAANDAVMKLLIMAGVFQWHDAPHLHHPLISLRIDLSRRRRAAEQYARLGVNRL